MILIRGAEVYAPEPLGKRDVLTAGERVVLIDRAISPNLLSVETVEANGMILTPGFVDQHVHITGGGGEGGFRTRAPEVTLSQLIAGGVTTVVGVLGTDGVTRSVENLVAKAMALTEEGVTCYAATGSYAYPSVTLTGSVYKDIVFISELIGVKVAVSDHRSASITADELARLASEARAAGMLSGKPGIVIIHMGDGKAGLDPVNDVLERTDIPAFNLRPTHVNRNERLCAQAIDFAARGGRIDINPDGEGGLSTAGVLRSAKSAGAGASWERITVSSDGQGSWSRYDDQGRLVRMGVSSVAALLEDFRNLILNGFAVEDALPLYTRNVAAGLGIHKRKGCVAEGSDADLLLFDQNMNLRSVMARGRWMARDGEAVVRGTYE